MIINLARIDFCPGSGGSADIQGEKVVAITENGTATITPDAGYDGIAVVKANVNVQPNLGTLDADPTTSTQVISAESEGYDGFSSVTIEAVDATIDSNIVAGNIKKDVEILGVTGTFEGGTTPTGTISITNNGTFDVTDYASASVNVGGTDYRYRTGTVPGLDQIGWDAASIGMYEQNVPHYSWENDNYAISQENIDLYSLDDPTPSLYNNDPKITFVPKKNMQSYFAQSYAFYGMKYIKGIPMYDTSSVTSMANMFGDCSSLQTIPELDTSSVTNMNNMFNGCSSLQTIPELDTSSVTNMNNMFSGCTSLTSIPELDTSSVTNMNQMFRNCTSLTSIPELDTSSVTNMQNMFNGCSLLQIIPELDTGLVTNMENMFYGCTSLTSIISLDTSSVTNMNQMFYYCSKLTTIPELDTSSATNMQGMFYNCSKLTTIPELDTSSATNMNFMFYFCSSLTTVNGIDFSSLSSAPSNFIQYLSITHFIVNGSISFTWNGSGGLDLLTNIDYDSVKSILQAMGRCTNPETAKTMKLNRTIADQGGELAALVADCQSKGWTITGLTLQ